MTFRVRSDLDVRCQLPIGPEGVPERTDVTHQHLLREDPVDRVSDLSKIEQRLCQSKRFLHTTFVLTSEKLPWKPVKYSKSFQTMIVVVVYFYVKVKCLDDLLVDGSSKCHLDECN